MRGLFLYGASCTGWIWDKIRNGFSGFGTEYASYPHAVTQNAESVSDVTSWVYEKYKFGGFDFIAGHSMGGIIALELLVNYGLEAKNVILIDSNLRPAKEFYRNLMLPHNMEKYGRQVLDMIKGESRFYSEALKRSLHTDFDYTGYIKSISCNIFGIYGDRGVELYDRRIDDLCLDDDIQKRIGFRFIRNACHLPMIENSVMLIEVIKECLGVE